MTYTAVNQHACCTGPHLEDDHTYTCHPLHPHILTHLTNNNRLSWKTDGRLTANCPPTTVSQKSCQRPSTPSQSQPRPPMTCPSLQRPTLTSQSQGQVPITETRREGMCLFTGWYTVSSRCPVLVLDLLLVPILSSAVQTPFASQK
jgi:hypothetical protein